MVGENHIHLGRRSAGFLTWGWWAAVCVLLLRADEVRVLGVGSSRPTLPRAIL